MSLHRNRRWFCASGGPSCHPRQLPLLKILLILKSHPSRRTSLDRNTQVIVPASATDSREVQFRIDFTNRQWVRLVCLLHRHLSSGLPRKAYRGVLRNGFGDRSSLYRMPDAEGTVMAEGSTSHNDSGNRHNTEGAFPCGGGRTLHRHFRLALESPLWSG